MSKTKFERKGNIIISSNKEVEKEIGKQMVCKTINAAKRMSRKLSVKFGHGKTIRG